MKKKTLFIPGPVEVRTALLEAMASPMIGHRTTEFRAMYSSIIKNLKKVFKTNQQVYLSTSSGSGLWEAAIRNCVKKKVLCCVNGAFSKRWSKVAKACNKDVDILEVPWGSAIRGKQLLDRIREGNYDAVTIVHNETSTGVMNPINEIAGVMEDFPETLLLVDAVSSLGGVSIPFDILGIDVCLASTQKAFGLPPGISVVAVSDEAMERSSVMDDKGYYFDFHILKKYADRNETPATPNISLMYALEMQLKHMISEESLEERYRRHVMLAHRCREWAVAQGFTLFSERGYASVTLTCIKNNKDIDLDHLTKELGKEGFLISNGYGKLKGKTFRIAHMADTTPDQLNVLLKKIDEILLQ